ncbi:MAG: hypothetical protein EZS28_051872 [Streblomastix strix]|uniref:Uncharacterized protein n=1 Tax=Streblomastix strix TaxID=222440 RepID=A0A5J4SY68_9EUKA|nr:MAG: hypothetical protein EZS28_051872 [Streblomastix strix]
MMEIIPKTQINTSTTTTICSIGNIGTGISPPTPLSTTYPISLATKRKTLTCHHSYRNIRITTDSTEVWGINDDVDEALLDAAGLSDFPELYAYIHEREPKPIVDGIANQIIIGPQYLQDQVKDNDDKLNQQPIPQPIVPVETPQVQIFKIPKSQLAPNVQMYNPADEYFYFYKLRNKVVYNIGLYLSNDFMGFIFTNFLEDLYPFSKHALVLGDDVGHKQNVM